MEPAELESIRVGFQKTAAYLANLKPAFSAGATSGRPATRGKEVADHVAMEAEQGGTSVDWRTIRVPVPKVGGIFNRRRRPAAGNVVHGDAELGMVSMAAGIEDVKRRTADLRRQSDAEKLARPLTRDQMDAALVMMAADPDVTIEQAMQAAKLGYQRVAADVDQAVRDATAGGPGSIGFTPDRPAPPATPTHDEHNEIDELSDRVSELQRQLTIAGTERLKVTLIDGQLVSIRRQLAALGTTPKDDLKEAMTLIRSEVARLSREVDRGTAGTLTREQMERGLAQMQADPSLSFEAVRARVLAG